MKKRKNNIFNTVKMAVTPSNTFDLSHDVKLTFGMGTLVPIVVQEVVPGDKWSVNTESMLRLAPLVSPVMHRIEVTQHFYFVPNRILWPGWEKWITREVEEAPPTMLAEECDTGTLGDYLGYISVSFPGVNPPQSAFPVAAYAKIWDDWYRDQNLQEEVFTSLVSGDNSSVYGAMVNSLPLRRAWEHDYFTSCLPFAQKGDAVQIPLTTSAGQAVYLDPATEGTPQNFVHLSDYTDVIVSGDVTAASGPVPFEGSIEVNSSKANLDPNGTLKVDVQADATDINSLRRAFRLQEWLEKNARGGTRYVENILAHFGVRSSDARLQRSEYLGGTKSRMVISEVLATAQTYAVDELVPLGQMGGHGISVDGGNRFSFYAEEHGWIIGLINVQPVTAYQQGIPRHLTRFDPLDYYWPTFANIGEQEVKNKELFLSGDPVVDEATFGYIPRYSEYKYAPSRVHGEMRSSLAFWHLGRIFEDTPALNEEFIQCLPRDDIFAVVDTPEQTIIAHIFVNAYARRKMPRFGVPQI